MIPYPMEPSDRQLCRRRTNHNMAMSIRAAAFTICKRCYLQRCQEYVKSVNYWFRHNMMYQATALRVCVKSFKTAAGNIYFLVLSLTIFVAISRYSHRRCLDYSAHGQLGLGRTRPSSRQLGTMINDMMALS